MYDRVDASVEFGARMNAFTRNFIFVIQVEELHLKFISSLTCHTPLTHTVSDLKYYVLYYHLTILMSFVIIFIIFIFFCSSSAFHHIITVQANLLMAIFVSVREEALTSGETIYAVQEICFHLLVLLISHNNNTKCNN